MIPVKNVSRSSGHRRITAPLRFVGYQFARGKHLLKIMPAAFQTGGGVFSTLMKALNLFWRDGLSGVKRGIRFVQAGNDARHSTGFDRNDYAEWVRRYDTIDSDKRKKLVAVSEGLLQRPRVSIVMPTYNPDPAWLAQAIESVRQQIYSNWELCIADDASTDPEVRRVLERYAHTDARIKVAFREINGHISAASNSALAMATGTWIALLDHDDLLPEHALVLIAQAIVSNADAGLIYTDEDKIDEYGNRTSPYFKCDLNLELLRAQNMISHLGVYRRDLVENVGGFRMGFEGSQDYDLALRVVDLIAPSQVVHIPHVLYHWRIHAASTSMDAGAKTYAQDAGLKALSEHLQRRSVSGSVELTPFMQYRIRYATPLTQPLVSLVIPTRNGLHLIRQCVSSILEKTTYRNFEILIIDNGSDDPRALQYFSEIAADPRITVIRDDSPFNYSALNNRAVTLAQGEFVALLNNDIEVITPGWLEEMLSLAALPGHGAVGARLWYPDNTLQHGGVVLGLGGVAGHAHSRLPRGHFGYFGRGALIQGVSCVTAACLLIHKSIYWEVGGLNESDLRVAFNDVDFCLKVRAAGYQNIWTPFAEFYHHESATRGGDDTPEKKQRFAAEVAYMQSSWGDTLLLDPAYNPNLTLEHGDFSLAWPPRVQLCQESQIPQEALPS
ncbi:glycosyltransferase family 2 protein [Uliginosibacterium sp. H3]|uniref:Glycosyltransferase family 2 protein n=1 Tax=Uliginosibacterium silvisoli TaxID=3114758 RepID=A0ABU6K1W8_9RHOO|nr:glycosyltransferase family 2 protein [Uliginosibacterium sp. H3]